MTTCLLGFLGEVGDDDDNVTIYLWLKESPEFIAILTTCCLWKILTGLFDYLDMGLEIMQLVGHQQTTIVDQKMSGKSRTNMFGDWLRSPQHVRARVVEW